MELILNLLYLYVAIYSVYFLVLGIKNLNDKKLRIQQRYGNRVLRNSLCVIIYSHNNEMSLENLIRNLKIQDYPQEYYAIYVILDNCTDNSEKLFLNDPSIQVFSIKNQDTVGKDQAISILLEKLSAIQNCNAYVFLDASRHVEKDFLSSVNSALETSPVISGATILVGEKLNLRQRIKLTYHRYYNNFLLKSRSLMGLATTIDSEALIMRQDLMEKIGCVDFQNINTELKYSLLLSKIGCKCVFNPNVKTYINIDEFDLRIPSLSARLSLFKNCLMQMRINTFVFNEYTLSLLKPNIILVLLIYSYLLQNSYKYYFMVDFSVVLLSFIVLILGFSISLLNSKLHSKDFIYLFLYPIYSMGHIFKNFPLCRKIRNKITGKMDVKTNTQEMIVNVSVSDVNNNNIPCKLELISENGLAKVKFMFKKKKFTTGTHLRMVDAIAELTQKLADYGFVLKICQCCANFSPNIDGSTNMVKGFCNHQFANGSGSIPTLLWNSCRGFNQNTGGDVIEEIFR